MATTTGSLTIESIGMTSDDTPIVAGYFSGTVTLPTSANSSITLQGSVNYRNVFVAAMNRDDTYFAWATQTSGGQDQLSRAVAVAPDGTVFITGEFQGTMTLPTGPSTSVSLVNSNLYVYDVFVAAMRPGSSYFSWAQRVGNASYQDYGYAVTVGPDGHAYFTGMFTGSASFPTGPSTSITLSSTGGTNGETYVASMSGDDSYFEWAQRAGGGDSEYGKAIAVTPNGTVMVGGRLAGTSYFPRSADDSIAVTVASSDLFIAAMDDSYFTWVRPLGGTNIGDSNMALTTDSDGSTIVAGAFSGSIAIPTGPAGSITLTSAGSSDLFVASMSRDDSYFEWAQRAGGPYADTPDAITRSLDDTIVVTGRFGQSSSASQRTSYYPSASDDSIALTSYGGFDTFIVGMTRDDSCFSWAQKAGTPGTANDGKSGVAIARNGAPLQAGTMDGTGYFPSGPATSITASGAYVGVLGAWPSLVPPGKPRNVTAQAGDASAEVSWVAPDSAGSRPVIEYEVAASPGGATCSVAAPALSCRVPGLTSGTTYDFRVRARSAVGWGPESSPSNAVTPEEASPTPQPQPPLPERPTAPLDIRATPSNAAVSFRWEAPTSSGAYPVTHYLVTVEPGGRTCLVTAPSTSCTINGLRNGTAYTATVKALTGAGWGPPSQPSNSAMPIPPPAPSIAVTVTRTPGDVDLVTVAGRTTQIRPGTALYPYVHEYGPQGMKRFQGTARPVVAADGTFAWKRLVGESSVEVIWCTEPLKKGVCSPWTLL